jgi:NitT/TauT family transport system substrate-binding protein
MRPLTAWASFGLVLCLALASCAPAAAPAAKPAAPAAQAPSSGAAAQPAASAAPAAPAAQAAPAPKKFRVLLPFREGITFFPISVAQELGYLKAEGVDMEVQVANGSSAVIQQLGAGNGEIGVNLGPNTLLGYAEGVKYKAFYDFLTKNTFDVKVMDGSPINSLADLRGKTIGTIDLTRGDLPLLRVQLRRAGLDPQRDVNIVALGQDMAVHAQALREGKADALNISWNNTVAVEAAGTKLKCITCDTQELQLASETVVATMPVYQRDRQYLVGFGRALGKATLFAQTNPDAAIAIMAKVAPQEHTDPAFARTFFLAALDIMQPRQPGKYGLSDLGGWERLQDYMQTPSELQATGLTTKVNIPDVVTNELVDEMNTFDAEAVRKQAADYRP